MTDTDKNIQEDTAQTAPSLGIRLAALLLYLGCAPLFWLRRPFTEDPFWQRHRKQAALLWAVLGLFVLFFVLLILAASLIMVEARGWFETHPVESWLLSLMRKAILVWLVFWLYAVWRCLRGREDAVPYLGRMAEAKALNCSGRIVVHLFFIALILFPPAIVRAESLVKSRGEEGGVYVLYDDQGRFPRWIFSLAVWRLSFATRQCMPGQKLALLPATRANLDEALDKASFIFAGTHGTTAGLLLQDGLYAPDQRTDPVGVPLQFIYLAGCDSGYQQEAWEACLAPATLRSFDRLTPTLEHLWRLWTEIPAQLYSLHGR